MSTIQVVVDEPLLRDTDKVAKQSGINRSALIREALREHLKRLHLRELEERDREGYKRRPDTGEDLDLWENVAAWPED